MKTKSYGFQTPVRRGVNNKTGNKVGGELTGGECRILYSKQIALTEVVEYVFNLPLENAVELFGDDTAVAAIGGFFISSKQVLVKLEIADATGNILAGAKGFIVPSGSEPGFIKLGVDYSFSYEKSDPASHLTFKFRFEPSVPCTLAYTGLSYGFVESDFYIDAPAFATEYFNSKRQMQIPEQFYFVDEIELEDSSNSIPVVLKSCNRCQRFLPINHFNERQHLSFSSHCVKGAPCTHKNFSKYTVDASVLDKQALVKFIDESTVFTMNGDIVVSHFGHQLECRSCKKFFVNAALNHLRTSTQHREDSLRRRAFEKLIGELTGDTWIYHKYRQETGKEFDVAIWEAFDRKCFNCQTSIATPNKMHLDHTMPLASLYPLNETATCLCAACNSSKHDAYPVDFYSQEKLMALSKITGLSFELLKSKTTNQKVVDALRNKITWFFDDFITFEEYTKVREGKVVADSIIHSLQKAVKNSMTPFNLVEAYSEDNK